MLCSLLKKELIGLFGVVMGCFFGCFRIRGDDRRRRNLVSKTAVSKTREPVVSQNRLATLLQAEEDEENSRFCTPPEQINEGKILKDEARFLKACGTIAHTPVEIQKVSEKCRDVSDRGEGSEPFRFHSWLPSTSIEKLNIGKQLEQPPTPVKFGEGSVIRAESSEHTPVSFTRANGGGSCTDGTSSTRTHSGTDVVGREQCGNKSVRFKCEDDVALFSSTSSSSNIGGLYSKQPASGGGYSVSKPSPYPTPLRLTEEMQTPGTVFPANFDGTTKGRYPRIRSQYVYSALNPVENMSQLELLKEEPDLFEKAEKAEMRVVRGESVEREPRVEESLSSWLKPPAANQEGKKNFGRTPGDRPIIGLVAAHWNEEEEASRISPKFWDGNGIPNSTNKYKEDQKVSWHATPFEERLEKALSDESSITLRKDIIPSPRIDFEDMDESDTAISKLQPPTYAKPIVSV